MNVYWGHVTWLLAILYTLHSQQNLIRHHLLTSKWKANIKGAVKRVYGFISNRNSRKFENGDEELRLKLQTLEKNIFAKKKKFAKLF